MTFSSYLRSFLFPRKLNIGSTVSQLSLTAENGAWIKLSDHLSRNYILLIGVKELNQSSQWLKAISDLRLSEYNCFVAVINTQSMEQLRSFKTKHQLDMPFLYDPLALEARKFGLSGRRPKTRDGIVLIRPDGTVLLSGCGQKSPQEIIDTLKADQKITVSPQDDTAIPLINSDKVQEYCKQNPKTKLVDVRTWSEYEPDHIPDSIHIPVTDLPQRYSELGQSSDIILICQAGQTALSAAEFLRSVGATNIFVLEGGISSWTGSRITDGKLQ